LNGTPKLSGAWDAIPHRSEEMPRRSPTNDQGRGLGVCSPQPMPRLDDLDLRAVRSLRSALEAAHPPDAARRIVLEELRRLVPADLSSWNRITLDTGIVEREAMPGAAEPPGGFAQIAPAARTHPLLYPHAVRPRPAVKLSDVVEPRRLQRSELYADLLRPSGAQYGVSISVRPNRREAVVFALGRRDRDFSERDRDVLNVSQPVLEEALQGADARRRAARALDCDPSAATAAVALDEHGEIEQSGPRADRWLAEHFGAGEHPGWLPEPVASWLAIPPRPPLVSVRGGRRLTVRLLPGDPHMLLLDEQVESFRAEALSRAGLTPRERELLEAARWIAQEPQLADELFLSLHAVRERIERVEHKLGVGTLREAVAAALRASA
jgi:DNA-binding CsgD family transcriptional regulator